MTCTSRLLGCTCNVLRPLLCGRYLFEEKPANSGIRPYCMGTAHCIGRMRLYGLAIGLMYGMGCAQPSHAGHIAHIWALCMATFVYGPHLCASHGRRPLCAISGVGHNTYGPAHRGHIIVYYGPRPHYGL